MSAGLPAQEEDKPRYVAAMFGRIAPRYDLMNALMTAAQDQRWRRLVARAAISGQPGERVLDVGTGTGRLAEAILALNPGARVVGVDFTQAMLRRAPRRIAPTRADALELPFADGQFDAVVSAFLVRNLASAGAGVDEQLRVLRPGGRLVILETTPGPGGVVGAAIRLYFRLAIPLLGRLIAGDSAAYTYLPESTLKFLEPSGLAALLTERGVIAVTTRSMALGSVAITYGRKPASSPFESRLSR